MTQNTRLYGVSIHHRHGMGTIGVAIDQKGVDAILAEWARENWEQEGVPGKPPKDDHKCAERYFDHVEDEYADSSIIYFPLFDEMLAALWLANSTIEALQMDVDSFRDSLDIDPENYDAGEAEHTTEETLTAIQAIIAKTLPVKSTS